MTPTDTEPAEPWVAAPIIPTLSEALLAVADSEPIDLSTYTPLCSVETTAVGFPPPPPTLPPTTPPAADRFTHDDLETAVSRAMDNLIMLDELEDPARETPTEIGPSASSTGPGERHRGAAAPPGNRLVPSEPRSGPLTTTASAGGSSTPRSANKTIVPRGTAAPPKQPPPIRAAASKPPPIGAFLVERLRRRAGLSKKSRAPSLASSQPTIRTGASRVPHPMTDDDDA